jgi:chloramphenicol 3-O-phosphotransferase
VYFSRGGTLFDALSIFRRPRRFDGVTGGCAVVVNGPSGSGKSSVLAVMADRSPLPWVMFDEPVVGAVAQPYLIWRDRAPGLHRGFLDAIAAVARRGNLVGFSAAGHPAGDIDAAMRGITTVRVGLDCELPILLERERGREGRWGGLVESSLNVHDGWRYDRRFDTGRQRPSAIAAEILELVGLELP